MRILDAARLSRVPMTGIRGHWTGGGHKANASDLGAYHVLTEGDGASRYGVPIAQNSGQLGRPYAAHTRNNNTNNIGQAMCGMAGATEHPWSPGRAPLTQRQWDNFVLATADLCELYRIAVARDKLVFHFDVPRILGIAQAGKWDVARLPFDESVRGAAIGVKWLDEVLSALRGNGPVPLPQAEPIPAVAEGATGITTAPSLNFRRGPGTGFDATGSLPAGIPITLLAFDGDWLRVRTPAGYEGWVHGGYVRLIDTAPAPGAGTVPDPIHVQFDAIRTRLDEIEADLPTDRGRLERAMEAVRAQLAAI